MTKHRAELLPLRIDPQTMADLNQELQGEVPTKGMKRLQQIVISADPMVVASLKFSRGAYGYPLVVGRIKHTSRLRCERCLDEVLFTLDQPLELTLKPKLELVFENTENLDIYEYDGKSLMLADLIEDELLLALPLVPRHEDISFCNQDMIAWLASNEVPAESAENPFAILKR